MAKNVYQTLEDIATKGLPPLEFLPHIIPEEALFRLQDIGIRLINREGDNIIKLASKTLQVKIAEQEKKLQEKKLIGGFTEEDCSF